MIQVNSIPISSKYFDFQDFSEVIQPSIKKLPSIFLPKNPDCIKTSTIQSTWTAFDGEWKKGKRLNLCSHKKCKLSKSCENNIFAPWENGSWASLKRGTWKIFTANLICTIVDFWINRPQKNIGRTNLGEYIFWGKFNVGKRLERNLLWGRERAAFSPLEIISYFWKRICLSR